MRTPPENYNSERGAPPSSKCTRGEFRYLFKSFILLWIVFAITNMVVSKLLIHSQLNTSSHLDSFVLLPKSKNGWRSSTPNDYTWPKAQKGMNYGSPSRLVMSTYRVAWNQDRSIKFEMDLVHIGAPFVSIEMKKTKIIENGILIHATPPLDSDPDLRWKLFGLILNPTLFATLLWLPLGLLPVSVRSHMRYVRYNKWIKQNMCRGCGYDIMDLSICPECGESNTTVRS
ncbi:MAG: hypothetical protein P1U42_09280 [Phycisphaerales bacterium]|nr:hypothetical protein [Phycisphaerales bacterium]